MSASIHGHEVMRMMMESATPHTPESLEAAIQARFGADARFHTCSAENMTARELVSFLAQRGKFTAHERGFTLRAGSMCDH